MNKYIKLSTNKNPGPSQEIFVHYYKVLWTNHSLQENYWNTENIDDILTLQEVQEALKQKMENHLVKIT